MREIKFRAWDRKAKKMFVIDSWNGMTESIESKNHYVSGFRDMADRNEVEIMQFTGLSDKNGKEIYEGDIVADNPRIIKNVPAHGEYDTAELVEMTHSQSGDGYGVEAIGWLTHWKDMEVIGNIYENPELIK